MHYQSECLKSHSSDILNKLTSNQTMSGPILDSMSQGGVGLLHFGFQWTHIIKKILNETTRTPR